MQRPERLWQQYHGKAVAELLRGSARWPLQPHPCHLEPPWDPYDPQSVSLWDCAVNQWEAPWDGNWFRRLFLPFSPLLRRDQPLLLTEIPSPTWDNLAAIVVEQFPEDGTTIPKAEQFLLSIPTTYQPVSFEIIGRGPQPEFDPQKSQEILAAMSRGEERRMSEAICGWSDPYTVTQFVVHRSQAAQVQNQLVAHYPNSAVVIDNSLIDAMLGQGIQYGDGYCAELALANLYCFSLRTFNRLDPDPLGVVIAAMEQLDRDQWAMFQVLFQPAHSQWAITAKQSVVNPYRPREYISDDVNERVLREKFSTPLFAVSVRILTNRRAVFQHLEGWADQFAAPPQALEVNKNEWSANTMPEHERSVFSLSVDLRCTHRPGMLLNIDELASLVHLPSESIVSERLRHDRRGATDCTLEKAYPGFARVPCYNCGFLAARATWWRTFRAQYVASWPEFNRFFSHRARCQWLSCWLFHAIDGTAVCRLPRSLHAHGHFGMPPGCSWSGNPPRVVHDNQPVFFAHHFPSLLGQS